MLKIYCAQCGSPTEYSLIKPKFCSSCGNSFYTNLKIVSKIEPKPIFNIKNNNDETEDYTEDYTEVSKVPEITNLDFDIDIEKNSVQKISDIAGSAKSNPYRELDNIPAEKNTKNIIEEFRKEAGSIRPKQKNRKPKNVR